MRFEVFKVVNTTTVHNIVRLTGTNILEEQAASLFGTKHLDPEDAGSNFP
jgi:hypothetical protein